jgi:hypothetical protein
VLCIEKGSCNVGLRSGIFMGIVLSLNGPCGDVESELNSSSADSTLPERRVFNRLIFLTGLITPEGAHDVHMQSARTTPQRGTPYRTDTYSAPHTLCVLTTASISARKKRHADLIYSDRNEHYGLDL